MVLQVVDHTSSIHVFEHGMVMAMLFPKWFHAAAVSWSMLHCYGGKPGYGAQCTMIPQNRVATKKVLSAGFQNGPGEISRRASHNTLHRQWKGYASLQPRGAPPFARQTQQIALTVGQDCVTRLDDEITLQRIACRTALCFRAQRTRWTDRHHPIALRTSKWTDKRPRRVET